MGDDTVNGIKRIVAFNMNSNARFASRRQRLWTRNSIGGFIGFWICYSLILLSILRCSESSVTTPSPSTATTAIASKRRQETGNNNRQQLQIRNPFKSERTIISGFGSRSVRKTIFGRPAFKPLATTSVEINEDDSDNDEKDFNVDAQNDALPSMVAPKMWARRPTFINGSKGDDALWILVRDDENESDDDSHVVLKITFDDERDDWVAKRATRKEELNFVRDHPLEKWIPIEGLYGTYKVPSGVLWILIAGTEAVYEAPPIASASASSPWWQIRRVTNLEIVHLGNKGYHLPEATESSRSKLTIAQSKATLLTASRLREEVRQIRLLRKALKQHEFYYVPNSYGHNNGGNHQVVRDMTKSLQRSILEENKNIEGSKNSWWKASDENDDDTTDPSPDARFFWNQHAVEPILRRIKENDLEEKGGQRKKEIASLLLQHVVPLTSAFVGVQKNITVSGENASNATTSYDQILISRRSRFRAGTRFTVRGADAAGDCANFAETEQICLTTTTMPPTEEETPTDMNEDTRWLRSVASHVQTRGSIPLRWSSPADVKTYRPRVNIGADPLAQARAMKLHILDQLGHYALKEDDAKQEKSPGVADIVFVNLVDKHSDQGRLGRAFDEVLQAVVDVHADDSSMDAPSKPGEPSKSSTKIGSDSVEHVWYDFHAEVKNGRWDRLSLLLDKVQPSLMSHGYFMAQAPSGSRDGDSKANEWSIQRLQNAVVRTNCMDCLDRTNVVQSIFGRYMLFQQLSNEAGESAVETKDQKLWAGLNKDFLETSMTLPWGTGEVAHRLLWADNADAISRLYAGTPALKGDFTRTGKRTKKGALDDGMNSLQRYYLNNFLDADRQEGYDLLVGHAAFSNVVEEDPILEDDGSSEGTNPSNPALSFLGATRGSILSDVVKGSSYQDREDLRVRLEEIGISKQPDLDLRWLPGDLQTQVRDQASEAPSNLDDGSKGEDASSSLVKENQGSFSSQQAMKAMDERSHAESPWWTKSDEDWLEVGDESDDEALETKALAINESSQHRSQVILTPFQLGMVLYVGLKAPTMLGGLACAILSFVYLPDCIKHDYQRQKSFRSYIEKKLNEENQSESEESDSESDSESSI